MPTARVHDVEAQVLLSGVPARTATLHDLEAQVLVGVFPQEGEPSTLTLRLGSVEPTALYLGTQPVDKVYLGSTQVWPASD